MHASLGLIIGVLIAVGAVFIYIALAGITFYGLAVPDKEALAAILFAIAVIMTLIFYAGFRAQSTKVKTGKEALMGAKGVATTDLKPKGVVRVMREFWQATVPKGASVTAGEEVEVTGMDGMTLVVKAAEQKA
jgi:membrane-bound ClpP family serine protease